MKIISSDGRLETMNPAGLAMIEADSLDDIRGGLVLDLIVPEYREDFLAMHRAVIGGQSRHLTYEIIGLKGTRRLLETHAVPMRNADGSVSHLGITRDITELKQAEATLRGSEERLRLSLDNAQHGLWGWDITTGRLHLDDVWYAIHGYGAGERPPTYELWEQSIYLEDKPRVMEVLQRHLDSGDSLYDVDYRARTKSGEWIWINTRGRVHQRDADGKPLRMMGTIHDVTARKQAEAALRESEALQELVLDNIPQGVFWKDRNSVYLGANRVSRQAKGIDAQQGVLGKTDFEVANFSRDQAESFVPKDREVIQSGQPKFGILETMSLADGSTLWLETNKLPIRDHAGNVTGVLGTWQDITERKRADLELNASHERLEILSRRLIETQESERRHLARELHDEIGQALTGIKLNLKAFQQPLPTVRARDLVKDTLDVVDRTLQQVRNLALDLRPSMLDDIGLVAALRWCLDRQSQRAGFVPCFSADSYVSSASPEIDTACFRIVQESLTNIARHANARNVSVELRQHDSELELLVQDDGIGFDVPAARTRAAQGASIGLLGMQERVQLVGGQIEIVSSPSQGTTVRARIPLASALSGQRNGVHE